MTTNHVGLQFSHHANGAPRWEPMREAIKQGVSPVRENEQLADLIAAAMWNPEYPRLLAGDD